jgi:hypothetical protein
MNSLRLLLLLSMGYLFGVAPNQVRVPPPHPDLVAGPWESVSPSGIDGIFFNIVCGPTKIAELR